MGFNGLVHKVIDALAYSNTLFLLTAFLTATLRLSSLALPTAVFSGFNNSSLRSSYITASSRTIGSYGTPLMVFQDTYFPSHHCLSNPRNTSHTF